MSKMTVQDVPAVPIVQTSSFILPRDAWEERGRGIERSVQKLRRRRISLGLRLNGLNVLEL